MADKYDLEVILLPVGLCHGDRDALLRVQNAGGGRFTLVDGVESPLEIGALISACDYFAGSSLHGNLTALSFGIPHLVVNTARLAKMEGFVQSARLEEFRITDWSDLRHEGHKVLVRYEDLRCDTLSALGQMYADLGIEVAWERLKASEEKHRWENVPDGDKGSGKFYRKAQPGSWREDLLPEQIRIIEDITGPVLSELY